ncbi:uncharacterized protein TrAtP1_011696 [Trichoderma atroviride]|uniref:uncharacterized protein n=1 Tax=Hypocrea atroviridis TaxID=63577 RepID=UPI0033292241|nr:hypothetical protein TrAtP1_011696 [Trichoderma atroviride]
MSQDLTNWEELIDSQPQGDCSAGDSNVVNTDNVEPTEKDISDEAINQDAKLGSKDGVVDKLSTEDSVTDPSGNIAEIVPECRPPIAALENDSQSTCGSDLSNGHSSNALPSNNGQSDQRPEVMHPDGQEDTPKHDAMPSSSIEPPTSESQFQNDITDVIGLEDSQSVLNEQEIPSHIEDLRELFCEKDTRFSELEKSLSKSPKTEDEEESSLKESEQENSLDESEQESSLEESEQESSSDSGSEHSVDPAEVSLPASPYFNPFDSPTEGEGHSRRGSIDNIPPLNDTLLTEASTDSSVKKIWQLQKRKLDQTNETLDKIMDMVGLEHIKAAFIEIKGMIDTARGRREHLKKHDFNLVLTGNPGTGKRSLSELYFAFLKDCNVWDLESEDPEYESMSGRMVTRTSILQDDISLISDGVFFLYDAGFVDHDARALLIDALNNCTGVILVVSGSPDHISSFLGSSPHGRWLFPRRFHIKDYDDEELRSILLRMIRQDNFKIQQGPAGPYPRILAKRVGYGREEPGFGNVHELHLAYLKILERQASRLRQRLVDIDDLWVEPAPDENLLTGEDIIGPEPEDCRAKSDAWKELQKMAGLDDVKQAISKNFDRAKLNYRREVAGKELLNISLNRVFLGPPGTGKTTVAKLYGQIITEVGLVPNQEVVFKVPSDFIGQHVGQSEVKTNSIIDATKGKVLIIDDAHMFFNGSLDGVDGTDKFRLACIDVIVSKIHNRTGEGRCIILIGYPDRMEQMFQKCNPGLRRRFPLEEAFRFQDYDDDRLTEILGMKMEESEIKASTAAMQVASEVLRRARDRPNFGNGGDVVNLLNQAKVRYKERTLRKGKGETTKKEKPNEDKSIIHEKADADSGLSRPNMVNSSFELDYLEMVNITLEPEDFDPNYNRGSTAAERCRALFDGLIGFEETIQRFQGYQRTAENLRRRNKNPRDTIPFTFVFKGPPGTGKTHTARIVGQIFYDMGILSTNEVVECSASQLIGKHVGHTGPKVIDLFEKSLGKILFIDEAYRLGLGGRNSFGDEAVAEIVDCMTKPRYQRKLVIVLAGYTREMDLLMKVNAGLRGRFTTEINFSPMKPRAALQYLQNLLSKQDIELLEDNNVNTNEYETVMRLFKKLSMTNGWSNGRDINTLAGAITDDVYNYSEVEESGKSLFIRREDLIKFLKDMLRQRIKGGVA